MISNASGSEKGAVGLSSQRRSARADDAVSEFLNPKSMITPGLAGALTMAIANTVYSNFGLQRPYIALTVAALFAVLAVGVAAMPFWQKPVYFLLNTLIVFTMALGANTAGDEMAKPTAASYPHGAFEKRGSLSIFSSEAFAKEYPEASLVKGSGPPVYIIVRGQRRWIPDSQTFDALGLNWGAIMQVPDSELESIPRGPDYPSLPGQVVKGTGPAVYLLQNGYRRVVPDPETFEAIGLRWDSIRVIPDQALQLIPEAPQIQQQRKFFAPWFKK